MTERRRRLHVLSAMNERGFFSMTLSALLTCWICARCGWGEGGCEGAGGLQGCLPLVWMMHRLNDVPEGLVIVLPLVHRIDRMAVRPSNVP